MKTTLSCFALLLLFLPSRADDIVNIVDNSVSGNIQLTSAGESAAQAFVTGPDYTCLDFVTVRLIGAVASNSARVEVWRGDGNVPESKLTEIGTISDFGTVETNFRGDSEERPVLHPNTRYWIVVTHIAGNFDWRLSGDPVSAVGSTGELINARGSSADGVTWTGSSPGDYAMLRVEATPFTTTTVTSPLDDGSSGTLRQKIANASDCTLIGFAPGLSGETIVLNGTELSLTKNVVIDASELPAGITLSGNDASRIFSVSNTGDATLRNLTMTDGKVEELEEFDFASADAQGGAIFVDGGNLLLDCCVISDCEVVASASSMASSNVVASATAEGAGIYVENGAFVAISNSTISNNTATATSSIVATDEFSVSDSDAYGGGICLDASDPPCTLRVVASTIAGNHCTASATSGGGDSFPSSITHGGGLYLFNATTTIIGSTVCGNTLHATRNGSPGSFEDGAGINVFGAGGKSSRLVLSSSTIADNEALQGIGRGGGIYSNAFGIVSIENTILSGNSSASGPDVSDVFSKVNSGGGNLVSASSGSSAWIGSDILDQPALLGPLADNGGKTQTKLPMRDSLAIDNGMETANTPATDQRGLARIVVSGLDIGAVEAPDYAAIDALTAARAARLADLSRKLRKLKKKAKNANRKGKKAKAKKFKKQIKKLTKQIRSL